MGEVNIPIITSNRINTPEVAEEVLQSGAADMVSMARPFLADPDFVAKTAAGQAALIAPCIACNQACLDHTFSLKMSTCLVNPRACYETELVLEPTGTPKRIAIVGAGPAGLATAIAAAERGHHVSLFDAAEEIGGQLNLAKQVPGKEEFKGLVAWYRAMLETLDIKQHLGRRVGVDDLTGFDEVVIATGALPRDPEIKGQDLPHVLSYADVLRGADVGKRVAVIGAGGIGFDIAEYLVTGKSPTLDLAAWKAEWGVADPEDTPGGLADSGPQPEPPLRQVTLLQRKASKLGKGLGKTTGWIHRAALHMKDVAMIGGVNYEEITAGGLMISEGEARENPRLIKADNIVLCAGQVPERSLADALAAKGMGCHIIGGADVAAELDAKRAILQGTKLAMEL